MFWFMNFKTIRIILKCNIRRFTSTLYKKYTENSCKIITRELKSGRNFLHCDTVRSFR